MKWDAFVAPIEPPRAVPILLAVVAGYVDACTFLGLFGLFVAQVTGSFVIAGLRAVVDWPDAAALLAVPVFFTGGIAATLVAVVARARGRSPLAAAFALEAALLIGFVAIIVYGAPLDGPKDPAAAVASMFGLAAMGVQSALVRLLLKGVPSTNVMTTNTSQIAIDLTQWLVARMIGRRHHDPQALQEVEICRARLANGVPVALGFLAGTVVGALAYAAAGHWALIAPIGAVAALAVWAARKAAPAPPS